jgi:O-antigen/teichoic acid export membrane protein
MSLVDRIRSATRSGQFRNVLLLVGGAATGQLLVIVTLPLMTRLYTPAAFGIAAVFTAIIVPLNSVASFRYELAIPIPEDDNKAVDLLSASIGIVAINTVLLSLTIAILGGRLVDMAGVPEVRPFLWVLPLAFIGGGLYNALTYYAIRHKAFREIARTRISQGSSQVIVQATLGFVGWGAGGLVAGITARFWAGMVTMARVTVRRIQPRQLVEGLHRFWSTVVEFRRFPLLTGNATFIQLLLQHIPALMVAIIYGPVVAGLLALSLRLLQAPVNMIGKSTAQVYYSAASDLVHDDPAGLKGLYVRTVGFTALLAAPILVFLLLPAPWTFPFLFGEEWRDAGLYIQALSVMFFLSFLAKTVGPETLTVVGRQGLHLVIELIKAALVAAVFAVALTADLEPVVVVIGYGGAMAIGHLLFLWTGYRAASQFGQRPRSPEARGPRISEPGEEIDVP